MTSELTELTFPLPLTTNFTLRSQDNSPHILDYRMAQKWLKNPKSSEKLPKRSTDWVQIQRKVCRGPDKMYMFQEHRCSGQLSNAGLEKITKGSVGSRQEKVYLSWNSKTEAGVLTLAIFLHEIHQE